MYSMGRFKLATADKLKSFEQSCLFKEIPANSLAVFRFLFGLLMVCEVGTYFYKGWIEKYFLRPSFHFSYVDWIQPLSSLGMHGIFVLIAFSGLGVALGKYYRWSSTLLFLSFGYMIFIDKGLYLNHFYLMWLVTFLLMFFPGGEWKLKNVFKSSYSSKASAWHLYIIKAQLCIVFFYATATKLNSDWLSGKVIQPQLLLGHNVPILGQILEQEWAPFFFAYGGFAFDLLVIPALLYRRTRLFAFFASLMFHGINSLCLRIGIFPYFMLTVTTLFFDPTWPVALRNIWQQRVLKQQLASFSSGLQLQNGIVRPEPCWKMAVLFIFLVFQAVFPLRPYFSSSHPAWTEKNTRFSWRMIAHTKLGSILFKVVDRNSGKTWTVNPRDDLSSKQLRFMKNHGELVLQYAQFLKQKFADDGYPKVQIFANSTISLNKRPRQEYIDSTVDLAALKPGTSVEEILVPVGQKLIPERPYNFDRALPPGKFR